LATCLYRDRLYSRRKSEWAHPRPRCERVASAPSTQHASRYTALGHTLKIRQSTHRIYPDWRSFCRSVQGARGSHSSTSTTPKPDATQMDKAVAESSRQTNPVLLYTPLDIRTTRALVLGVEQALVDLLRLAALVDLLTGNVLNVNSVFFGFCMMGEYSRTDHKSSVGYGVLERRNRGDVSDP